MAQLLRSYFETGRWERPVYERIGVRQFSRLLIDGMWFSAIVGTVRGRPRKVIRGRSSARRHARFTITAESIHVLAFTIMVAIMVSQFAFQDASAAMKTGMLNIVVNVYPMMVQRYNRDRLLEMLGITVSDLFPPRGR